MNATRLTLILLALLVLFAGPRVRADDDPPETPEQRAKRLKVLAAMVVEQLPALEYEDAVGRGDALEVIAGIAELEELGVAGLAEAVRKSGVTASERFIAVLAGEILNRIDPQGTIEWLRQNAFGAGTDPVVRRNGLAILSEIRDPKSGQILADHAVQGSPETRVEALFALGKLRMPETYGAMISALGSSDQAVKDNAALALGKLRDARAIPNLLAHLNDADGDHPAFAAWALKQFEDPQIFAGIRAGLGADSGEPEDAKARIIESCSMPEHIEDLKAIFKNNRSMKYRYAAALALGRLGGRDLSVQELLLNGLVKGKDDRFRSACFFGLSRCAGPGIAEPLLENLKKYANAKSDDDHRKFRALAFLAGDLKLPDAAPILYRAAVLHQTELTWRIAAVNLWKCEAPDAFRYIKDEFDKSSDSRQLDRLAAIFGRSRRMEEFRFLINQFRRFGKDTAEAFSVELAVEQMTGHFFGPEYAIWRHWIDANPEFFTPRDYRIDRRAWQKAFTKKDREFRQTEATERAVQLGLAWISRHQSLQGSLDPNKFFDMCSHEPSCKKTGARHMLDKIGCTSLATLALLGGGYSPYQGKYKDTLRRYIDYIQVRQTADGDFTTTDRFQGYQRPIAIYALAEAFNITGDMDIEPYLRRGINYLVEIQNELGGWHYQAGARETDTSVMSWVLLGLSVAHKSGFAVRESVFEGCDYILQMYSERVTEEREEYLDLDPAYGYDVGKNFRNKYQTGYQSKVSENATVAFGLMSRMFMGWRRSHPFCIGSARFIIEHKMEEIPKGDRFGKYVSKNRFPSYAWYYGTLAMHQMGGHFFREWNQVIKELLPGIQLKEGCDAGAFEVLNYDFVAGKAYSTCMGVLTLETYYRYKPFCEEGIPEEDD